MTPKELLLAHRYSDAVEAIQKHMASHPHDNYYQTLGISFLCLERFHDALAGFRKDNEIEAKRRKGSNASANWIGVALWLLGKREEAMQEWHRAASGVLDGNIRYGDPAGGATQGLLLWYAAVTLGHAGERDYALKFLRHIKDRKVFGSAILWPRPVALMIVGDYAFEKVLEIGIGVSELVDAVSCAESDLLKRRQLCQVLFYAAVRDRDSGNKNDCAKKMLSCCGLENPILEMEWYLAREECRMTTEA